MTALPGLEVTLVTTNDQIQRCLAVRRRVFIEEQRVPEHEEIDAHDADPSTVTACLHVLATLDGEPVGTGRLLMAEPDGRLHVGRVAVLAEHRRRGIGRAVMLALHDLAHARNAPSITLAAQLHAIPFYERLGYVAYGDVFLDANIEHRWMDLKLPVVRPLDVVIESERLRLVPASKDYAQAIFREFTPEITTYMFPKPPERIDETLAFIRGARDRMARGVDLDMAILLKASGEFLGHGGVHNTSSDTPELGIWIKAGAQGNAYGREAVTALTRWAFANLSVRYLTYPVDRRNIASRKIPESLGGVVESEYEMRTPAGNTLDIVEYRIYPAR